MYREDIPFVTLFGTPVATAALWYLGHLTLATNQALVGVAIWLCWQRFSAAGYRIPGRKRVGPKDAAGKVAIVTGANTGIGFWTAVGLVEAGAATVVVTCRDETKVKDTIAAVRAAAGKPQADVRGIVLELGSFKKVKAAAEEFKALKLPLHILVNNAGAAIPPDNGVDRISEDKLELGYQGNFVSHVLFTELLVPMVRAARGRVVNVASRGHQYINPTLIKPLLEAHPKLASVDPQNDYVTGLRTYCLTKLGNVYHAQWLAKKYPEITAVALHPGCVSTDVWRFFNVQIGKGVVGNLVGGLLLLCFKTSPEGAATTLHCAIGEGVQSGKFYVDEAVHRTAPHASKLEYQDAMMSHAFSFLKPYLTE